MIFNPLISLKCLSIVINVMSFAITIEAIVKSKSGIIFPFFLFAIIASASIFELFLLVFIILNFSRSSDLSFLFASKKPVRISV